MYWIGSGWRREFIWLHLAGVVLMCRALSSRWCSEATWPLLDDDLDQWCRLGRSAACAPLKRMGWGCGSLFISLPMQRHACLFFFFSFFFMLIVWCSAVPLELFFPLRYVVLVYSSGHYGPGALNYCDEFVCVLY